MQKAELEAVGGIRSGGDGLTFQMSGKPQRSDMVAYRDWMLGLQQFVADTLEKRIMHVFSETEIYILDPHQPARRVT